MHTKLSDDLSVIRYHTQQYIFWMTKVAIALNTRITGVCHEPTSFYSLHYSLISNHFNTSPSFHFYADNVQLYVSFSAKDSGSYLSRLLTTQLYLLLVHFKL